MYKNIYRVLKAFYLISIYLNYNERRKLANMFIFLLNLYNIKFNNMIKIFCKLFKN